jgi:uncharacterized protein YndB with AHSA1/START domain
MITIETIIAAPVEKVWAMWSEPQHIQQWNFAGDDWHCPKSVVDLRTGGSFVSTMAARDGSFSFDFGGVYESVEMHKCIAVLLGDGRKWITTFESHESGTRVVEAFEPENQNPEEMQQAGWQMILDRFKGYVEAN